MTSTRRRWLAALMPGIFLIGYNIGTGSVTAMSKAGANYGTGMLWAVLVSCLITWYLINFFSRFTMASGMTAMEAFRRHIHPAYAWVLWGALSIIILGALMGMLGLLVDVVTVLCEEMSKDDKGVVTLTISKPVAGVVIAAVVLGLIWIGNTRRFEAMLGVMVALMGLAFISSAVWFFPGIEPTLDGFIPRAPTVAPGSDTSPEGILAGMVGTTVSVFAFLVRSGQMKDHNWTMADWKAQKRDALVSATMMFILSAAVLLTAAGTLHKQGMKMNNIAEVLPMLRPMFGAAALLLFTAGVLSAGISSHMPNMMIIPWLTQDTLGKPRSTRTTRAAYALGLLTLVSVLGVILKAKPVFLMLMSQAGISVVMPMALLGLMALTGKKSLVGEHRPGKIEWILLGVIAAFQLFVSYLAICGLVQDIRKLL